MYVRESKIEKYLCGAAERRGWLVRKVQWVGRRGAPDRVIMADGLTVWVETKAPKGELSCNQTKEHKRMVEQGQWIAVAYTEEQVNYLILNIESRLKNE